MRTTQSIQEVDKYVAQINRIPLLTKDKEKLLLKEYQRTKSQKAANTIITSNLRFVVSVAHSYKGYGHPLSDLIQEGNKAMMRALEKFDPNKDIRFCSYAVYWIKAYMSNYVMKNHSMVKFGSTKTEKELFYNLKKTREKMENNGHEEVTKDLSTYFNVSEQDIMLNLNRLSIKDCSITAKFNANMEERVGKDTHADYLVSPDSSQEEVYKNKQRDESVQETMLSIQKALNERELFIVKNRLSSDDPMTLNEIGQHFGISRERTRQIESSLITKLQSVLEEFKES